MFKNSGSKPGLLSRAQIALVCPYLTVCRVTDHFPLVELLSPNATEPHPILGNGDLHFITCSCCQQRPMLGSVRRRNLFLKVL
jgi:hypothetical protein